MGKIKIILVVALILGSVGCSGWRGRDIGTLAGGGVGAGVGSALGGTGGAIIGAVGGSVVGHYAGKGLEGR